MSAPAKKLKVVCVHAAPDESYARELAKHLLPLEMGEQIECWHSWRVLPGEEPEAAIAQQIEQADIIIPLLSIDFITTPETFGLLGRVIDRHHQGAATVIPVKVRAADYSAVPLELAGLKVLPSDGSAVSAWVRQDEAWAEVAREVRSYWRVGNQTRNQNRTLYAQPGNRFLLGIALFAVLGLFLSVDASAAQQGDLETGAAAIGTKDPSPPIRDRVHSSFFLVP